MGFFYLDESIHEKAGFIIGAFVYHKTDITPLVFAALAEVGLRPGIHEFKSGARMIAPTRRRPGKPSVTCFQALKQGS